MAGPVIGEDGIARCPWAVGENRPYHDDEWGRPVRGEVAVFERLTLEAFQSGLSWLIILRKRPAFREAFSGFDLETVAAYDDARLAALMEDAGIVRNRQKIEAARTNARAAVALRERGGLEDFVWSFRPDRDPGARDDRAAAHHLTRVAGAVQGAQEGRLHLRRPDHHVRPDGGDRDRRHAPRRLPPAGDQRRLGLTRVELGSPVGRGNPRLTGTAMPVNRGSARQNPGSEVLVPAGRAGSARDRAAPAAGQVARVYAAARSAGAGEGAVVRLVPSGPTVQVCPWGLVQVYVPSRGRW